MLLRLSPVVVGGHITAIAQQIVIPVVASTDAPIARFDSANEALQLIVGTRQVLDIVALDQPVNPRIILAESA